MFLTCDTKGEFQETSISGNKSSDNNEPNTKCLKNDIEESANFLKDNTEYRPKIGIICGSGLGALSDELENPIEFPYSTIPHFPTCTVTGHEGKLIFGKISEVPVLCMKGRLHLYEGYPLWKCTLPVRIMKLLGVKLLITTNASGGVNENFKTGDVMIIEDHIDLVRLFGHFSLRGPPNDLFDFNYSPVNTLYSKELIDAGLQIGEEIGLKGSIHKGIYAFAMGPNFESVADVRLFKVMGSDALGFSTVHEVIVAKDCGMDVFAFSLVTAMCSLDYDEEEEIDHEEVLKVGEQRKNVLKTFLKKIVEYVNVCMLAD